MDKNLFVVICDYAGDIDVLGSSSNYEEAYSIMETDYNNFIEETNPEDYYIEKNSAWTGESDNGESCNWYIRETQIPEEKKKSPLDDVMRVDFEKVIGPHRIPQAIFFNVNTISEKEIRNLIISGEYEHDYRVVIMHPDQFNNVFKG